MAIECTATSIHSATWDGTDGTIVWSIINVVGDTPTITAGQGTPTVTVQSISGAEVTFTLVATVTGVNGPVEEQIAVVHTHTDLSPNYIGPDVQEQFVVQGQALVPIETFNLFTGDNLVFSLEGTWPADLVIGAANGEITGIATDPVASYANLTVRATNAYGFADSTVFTVTVTAGASAPVWSVVPPQTWQVGVPIAQLAMSTYVTGTLPIDYTIAAGGFPVGITMNLAGQINGTPTTESTGSVAINAANAAGNADSASWGWTIWEAIQTSTIPDQTFLINVPYSHDFSQYFTGTITSWAIGGVWPPGFGIDVNGVVTGTATVPNLAYLNLSVTADNIYEAPVQSNLFNAQSIAEVPPAFYALTPDETTYEMLGVSIGTGDLTTTHTADLYAPDFEGVYREFGADEPVWSGGRVAKNYIRNSETIEDGTYWSSIVAGDGSITITPNQLDPDGGTTAFRVQMTATGSNYAILEGTANTLSYASSEFRRSSVYIKDNGGVNNQVNITTGSNTNNITTVTFDGTWKRYTNDAGTAGNNNLSFNLTLRNNGAGTALGTIDILVWHPQSEVFIDGSSTIPNEYVPTEGQVTSAGDFVQKTFASTNGNTVLNNVVTEAVGTPLAEIPYLQYYPAAENTAKYSNDLLNWQYQQAAQTNTLDQVGLTGEPNTATLSNKTTVGNGTGGLVTQGVTTNCLKAWVKKDTDQTRFPLIQIKNDTGVFINTQTGHAWGMSAIAPIAIESIDAGDWWIMLCEMNTAASSEMRVWAAAQTTEDDGSLVTTATGSAIFGNIECHPDKTIAEVRGLGPIFTTTAAVATDATSYQFDVANFDNDSAAWYAETNQQGDFYSGWNAAAFVSPYDALAEGVFGTASTDARLMIQDSAGQINVGNALTSVGSNKFGASYNNTDNLKAVNYSGAWSNTATYTGFNKATNPAIILFGSPIIASRTISVPWQMRDLQRYDITSYAEGQGIIDDLMLDTLAMVSGTTAGEIGYSAPSESNYGTLTPDTSFGFTILELYEKNGDLILIVNGTQLQSIYDHITWLGTDFAGLSADTFSTAGGVSTWTWLNAGISPTSATNYDILVQVDQS